MNYKGYPIGIHIEENSIKTLKGIVQGDDGNLFQIQLYDGMDAFDFSGYTIINVVLERPDGSKITDFGTVTIEPSESDDDTPVSHTDLAIQFVDPENGRISLEVGGAATAQVGMHRMALEIYSSDKRLTTARINYNVVATLDDVDVSFLQNQEGYSDLQALVEQFSVYVEQEQGRVNSEQVREDSEAQRVAAFQEIQEEYDSMYSELTNMISRAEQAAEAAEHWAEVAEGYIYDPTKWPNPPATVAYVDGEITELSNRFDNLALRTLTEQEEDMIEQYRSNDSYLVLKTMTSSELVAWAAHSLQGEIVYCTDLGALYLSNGTTVPELPTAQPEYTAVVIGTTAPTEQRSVWIDRSDGNKLKFYNGSEWVAVGSVAFFS